jgi:MFS transporter, DHA1 family, tetracycline resistance protein
MNVTKKASVFPILLVNFIDSFGLSIVIPFLIFLVTKFGGNAFIYGILGASYPAFQLIGAPILGKWSDIYGRKKVLLLCEAGTTAGWGVFLTSFFLPMTVLIEINNSFTGPLMITLPILILFIGRAIAGLTGGNISVANAYIADVTDDKDLNKNFGKMSVASNLGFIAGPALAGILGSTPLGEMLPVISAMLISLAAIFVIFFFLKDSKPLAFKENPEKPPIQKVLGYENKECFELKGETKTDEKMTFKKVLKLKFIPYFLFLNFLIFLGFNFFYTAFPVHVVQKLGWSIAEMGIFFAILSLMMVIVQGPVLSMASKKYSDSTLILFGSIVLGTSFIVMLSSDVIVLYIAGALFATGNGLMWPSFLSLLSKTAGKKSQGIVQGFASSSGSLASIIGLIAGGLLYTSFGAATFLISAFIIYCTSILSLRLFSIEKKPIS